MDRKTIKQDIKELLSKEGRGTVFLATLLVFVIIAVYFGLVWLMGQFFFPINVPDIQATVDWMKTLDATQLNGFVTDAQVNANNLISSLGNSLKNILLLYLCAYLLAVLVFLPLVSGILKFMLRYVRYKSPSAGVIFVGYTPALFFRSILLPIWKGLCLLVWQLILFVLLCGIIAGIALATGYQTQWLTEAWNNLPQNYSPDLFKTLVLASAEYAQKFGWIYFVGILVWTVAANIFMIFKHISYSMAGIALAEKPSIGVRKALRTSRRITRRNHWRLFVTSLSFIGWYLLAELALLVVIGIGFALVLGLQIGKIGLLITLGLYIVVTILVTYLLMPYRLGVHARCYVTLKRNAQDDGRIERHQPRPRPERNRRLDAPYDDGRDDDGGYSASPRRTKSANYARRDDRQYARPDDQPQYAPRNSEWQANDDIQSYNDGGKKSGLN